MPADDFLKPTLRGKRFDGHAIPLDFLRDLGSLDEIIREIARAKYLDAHKNRQRAPKGFKSDSVLALTDIEEGSAKPVIKLVASAGLLLNPVFEYFQSARDAFVGAINAVVEGQSPADHIPVDALKLFKYFGDHLKDDESIVFDVETIEHPVVYTKEVRRKILWAAQAEDVQEEVELRGLIVELDKEKKTFTLKRPDGARIAGKITKKHHENIHSAFDSYKINGPSSKLSIRGVCSIDRAGKIIKIEKIEESDVLDPFDIQARLDELRLLGDGWLDGEGVAVDPSGLDWLETESLTNYSGDLPLPSIFATPEGGILFEWNLNGHIASLDINLATRTGSWFAVNLATKTEAVEDLDLDDTSGWADLGGLLRAIRGVESD